MATSGSYDFTLNRDQIIKEVLVRLGVIAYDESPDADMLTSAARALNLVAKTMTNNYLGIQLWKLKRLTLFLEKSKHKYSIGPSGDHCTESYTETAMRVAAASTDTTMEVDSTTGMTAADNVLVVMDDGNLHKTTVASVTDSDTFELTTGLSAASAVDNAVYFYTSKAQRPIDVIEVFSRDSNNSDITLDRIDGKEYWDYYDKDRDGRPTKYYYKPTLTNGTLYINYEQTDVTESLEMVARYPFEDFDSASDNADCPAEVLKTLIWNTALELAPSYEVPESTWSRVAAMAESSRIEIMNLYSDSPRAVTPTRF